MNKCKVLLVYPEIPTTYWSLKHSLPFVGKKTLMPPLGLITIAAMLPETFELQLLDLNIDPLTKARIEWADMVFISAMLVQQESFRKVAALAKELGKTVVAGGPYATNSYEEIENVDHFVLNEGEINLPHFLQDLETGEPKRVYYNEDKPDMALVPVPRFDLLDLDSYSTMALQNSRGCPFNCEFCDIIELFGRKPRYKTPQQIGQELDALYGLGYRGHIFIVDDNFVGNKNKAKQFLRYLLQWQQNHDSAFDFFTEASIDLANDLELLDLMEASGFDMVFIGLETPDESTLASTQKQQNIRNNLLDSVGIIQSRGIEVLAGFILGFDNEPPDIFERQVAFIHQAAIPMAMIGLMMVLPNTQLYRRLEKEKRILARTSGNNTHDIDLNFIPTTPKEKLIQGYQDVISQLYKPKNYFTRIREMISRFPQRKQKKPSQKVKLEDLRPLWLSLVKQGFSRYGHIYLANLLWVLAFRFSEIKTFITLAIKGHHFFIITQDIVAKNNFRRYCMDHQEAFIKQARYLGHLGKDGMQKIAMLRNDIYAKVNRRFLSYERRIQKQLHNDLQLFKEQLTNLTKDFQLGERRTVMAEHTMAAHYANKH